MRSSSVLAMAMASVVSAASWNNMTTPTTSETAMATPDLLVDGWAYYGCVASDDGFPKLTSAGSFVDNSPDKCAKACKGKAVFALHDNDCYCGTIDTDTTTKRGDAECDIACGGDLASSCGGDLALARLARRAINLNFLLTVYVSVSPGENPTVTATAPAETVTETSTATVTGPNGAVVTSTIINTIITVPSDLVIICWNGWCAPQTYCPVCSNYQVVCRDGSCCPEECHGDDWDKVVVCEGDDCHYAEEGCGEKISCTGSECTWEETEEKKKFVCGGENGDDCTFEECNGEDCGKKEICNGEDCIKDIPCEGESCPTPTPGSWVPSGCNGESCPSTETPVIASGAGQKAVAGVAAIMAAAVFVL